MILLITTLSVHNFPTEAKDAQQTKQSDPQLSEVGQCLVKPLMF